MAWLRLWSKRSSASPSGVPCRIYGVSCVDRSPNFRVPKSSAMRPHVLAVAVCCLLSFLATGCLKQILTDGQIAATRRASVAIDTIGDYELARSAAQSGLVQFEGMHRLAPSNTDALFMLAKGWTG